MRGRDVLLHPFCFEGKFLALFILPWFCLPAPCQVLDAIGVTALRQAAPTLNGAGVAAGQSEAGDPFWQVSPSAVGQPTALFTWYSTNGPTTNFPNSDGFESGHADVVGNIFYGSSSGIATNVSHVDNFEVGYFYDHYIGNSIRVTPPIMNQSWIFGSSMPGPDSSFDNYAAKYGTLFVNGAGNGGAVSSPATAYNCLAVGAYGGSSSIGPTTDGRCKPDITAPADFTSFSAPLVAGTATLLLQAAKAGAGGSVSAATNALTLKTLLLNGAVKPPGWTNSVLFPLDARYGAGIVHALNSYRQLRGGKQSYTVANSVSAGDSHLPPAATTNIPVRRGWDYNTIDNGNNKDAINHYFFDVNSTTHTSYVFTTTVAWQRANHSSTIKNLNLYLYNASNNVLVASSESLVNNVEHVYVPELPPGRYDVQVLKTSVLGSSETYALAWDFGPVEAPILTNPTVMGGQFQAQVHAEPSQAVVVQCSTNLQSWASVLTNNTSATGSFAFTNAAAGFMQIYRALQLE